MVGVVSLYGRALQYACGEIVNNRGVRVLLFCVSLIFSLFPLLVAAYLLFVHRFPFFFFPSCASCVQRWSQPR